MHGELDFPRVTQDARQELGRKPLTAGTHARIAENAPRPVLAIRYPFFTSFAASSRRNRSTSCRSTAFSRSAASTGGPAPGYVPPLNGVNIENARSIIAMFCRPISSMFPNGNSDDIEPTVFFIAACICSWCWLNAFIAWSR